VLSPSQVSRSLVVFVVLIVLVGVLVGHAITAAGIAGFVFVLAAIEAKPSWKRIWNPDPKREGGIWRFTAWKAPAAQRERPERVPKI
jgi:3-oxoacyl-(acyl-carrier-protein) synthase